MTILPLIGTVFLMLSPGKSDILPPTFCQPERGVCAPDSQVNGCPGDVMAFCNQEGQCCVRATSDDTEEEIPTGSCPPGAVEVPSCQMCTGMGGTCQLSASTPCCSVGVIGPPPATSCLPQPQCTSSSDCEGLTGGTYECNTLGQCCVTPTDDMSTLSPELQNCTKTEEILKVATLSARCLGDFTQVLAETTMLGFCRNLIAGLECVAAEMVGENLKTKCVDAMFAFLQNNPAAIFDQIKLYFGSQLPVNETFVRKSHTCRDVVLAGTSGEGQTDTENPAVEDETLDWNTKCPVIRQVGQAARCPTGCSVDADCFESNVCCSGPNSCPTCMPDLRRCTDPDAILSSASSCLPKLFGLIDPSIDFTKYCSTVWTGLKCIANAMMNSSLDFGKLCVERMAMFMKDPSARLEIIEKIQGQMELYMLNTGALDKYGMNTTRCKENPFFEPEARPPVSEDVNVCTNATKIMMSLRQCLGSTSLSSLSETNAACSTLKVTLYCVASQLLGKDTEEYQLSQCAGEVRSQIQRQDDSFQTLLGPFTSETCEERSTVCGGGRLPSDEYFCRQASCPAGYDCKGGYCCTAEKPGMCPQTRGLPVCKRKCTKDFECDEGDKCCDIGCGYKTCTPLETHVMSRCELEFENARKQLEKSGICGEGTTILKMPRCQLARYFPIQGDIQHGHMFCVNEDGQKVPGSDFIGNMDCTTVRPGRCPAKPAGCSVQGALILEQCKTDQQCSEGEKCCHTTVDNVCIKKCLTAEAAPSTITDPCPRRQCCPITLCQDKICPRDRTAVCRINSCGGCTVEFYNVRGEKVDCNTNVTLCQRKRAAAQQTNAQLAKSDMQRIASFVQAHERMGGFEDDMSEDAMTTTDGGDDIMDEVGDEMTDEYGELRKRSDQLPDDGMQEEDMTGIENMQMMRLRLETFCLAFMKYNVCQNGGECVLGRGESHWQMCKCPSGFQGLFCEKSQQLFPFGSMCNRDMERISTMLQILRKADHVKEKIILHEVFDALKKPHGLIPNFTCGGNIYLPVQQAVTFPRTSNAMNLYYCAHTNNGSRILGTPVSLAMSGSMPNCTVTGLIPDPLAIPRKCLATNRGPCTTGTCQYFWNQISGMCEAGVPGNGFRTLTECYDQCGLSFGCEASDDLMTETTCDEPTVISGPKPCRLSVAEVQVDQCDYATQFCDVSILNNEQVGVCKDFPAHCLEERTDGYGDKMLGAYFFSAEKRRCEKFEYKGSGGNANRFYSLHQCHTECSTRPYKYKEVVCPIPKALTRRDGLHSDMCDDDYDCAESEVCCSDGLSRVCTSPIATCFAGERCSLTGACVDGKCTCKDCVNTSAPVCGSNGKTYENMCLLERDACMTMRQIKKISDGSCNLVCGNTRCKVNEMCENNQCTCAYACIALYAPLCGRSTVTGMFRNFSNDCTMNQIGCELGEVFVKVHDGECVKGESCMLPCTKEYRPVCAYDTTDSTHKLTTYANSCEMKRDMICNNKTLDVFYAGPCNRTCASAQCQTFEVCENGKCTCPSICTLEYEPVCGFPLGNPSSLSTFSNGCLMRMKSCQEKTPYLVKNIGPCTIPEPVLLCPENDPTIPLSAEIGCNRETQAFCDQASEMCCPHGAGTRCIPKKALVRRSMTKPGLCPVLSSVNFDKSQCIARMSLDDTDCAGDAKSCWNIVCGHNTCTKPLVGPGMNSCQAGHMMVPDLTCDPSKEISGCPRNASCQSVAELDQDVGVCCIPSTRSSLTQEDLYESRLCQLLDFLGIQCKNGGTCIGDFRNGTICACPVGYYGPLCGFKQPPAVCENPVNCLVDPCMKAECPAVPDAVCESNYCGDCNALFKNRTMYVTHLCHASPCLQKRFVVKLISDKIIKAVGDFWTDFTNRTMQNDESMVPSVEMYQESLQPDLFMKHLLYVLDQMGLPGLPDDGELNCSPGGLYESAQCSWLMDRNATYCYCVDPKTGMPIPNGPKSTSQDAIDCTAYKPNNVGLQDFCLMVPNTMNVCSATEQVRFFYNPATMDCEAVTDTGCNEEARNNFNSIETCRSACGTQGSVLSMCARVRCGNSQQCRVRDGTAECVDPESPKVFEPLCDAEGMFESKQCQGDVCRCVNPETGEEIPNSIADGAALQCVKDGQTIIPILQTQKRCPLTGARPLFCEEGGNPCNNCQKQGLTGPQDSATDNMGVCKTCASCPAGQGTQDCGQNDPCKNAQCKSDSSAICRVNRCTCKAEFVSGDRFVDCSKAQSQCLKEKSIIETEQRSRMLSNNGQAVTDAVELKCSSSGGYEVMCRGAQCHCLNATTGEPVGSPVTETNINRVNCAQTQRKTQAKRLKVSLQVTDKPLEQLTIRQKEQIISKLKEEFEKRVPVSVKNITLYSGSTMADIEVENCVTDCQANAETTDLPSLVGTVVAEIDNGELEITAEGETFVPTAAAITGISTVEELEGPATEPTGPGSDDNKTTVIIIVVVVVVVVALLAIGIAVYCFKQANKSKNKDIPFTDIKGKDNPTYQN